MSDAFDELPDDILLGMIEDPEFDPNDENFVDSAENYIAESLLLDNVDITSGAPIGVRAQVNAAQREEDRLLTLQKFYPDAVRVEDLSPEYGAQRFGAGNFVYTDPETQEQVLFDERGGLIFGASIADLTADIGPEIFETIGAIGGRIGGTIAGIPATIPTAGIANPATLGAAGEGVGSATARESYIAILNFFGETEDNRTLGELKNDFLFTAGINAASGPILNKTMQGLKMVPNGVRYMADTMSVEAREAYKKIASIVSAPTAGTISVNPMVNLFERVLEKLPFSSKVMHEAAQRTMVEVEKYAANLAQRYGGSRTATEASDELLRVADKDAGISSGSLGKARERYTNEVNLRYQNINDMLPDTNIKQIDSLQALYDDLALESGTAVGSRTSSTGLAQLEPIFKDFSEGKLNWNDLRKLRTQLLADTSSDVASGATSKSQKNEIKRVIGGITDVLNGHIDTFGDKSLSAAYKETNKFVAKNQGKGGAIRYLDSLLESNSPLVENTLKSIVNSTKEGPANILKLKEVLTPEEFAVLPGYILGRLGLPTAGMADFAELGIKEGSEYISKSGFNPATFVKNWDAMSKEAKDVLFQGSEFVELGKELDNLVFTTKRLKKAGKMSGNASNSAQVGHAMGWATTVFGGNFAGFEFGFSSLALPYGSAKLMTDARFVKWLAEGTEIVATDPAAFSQHIRSLIQIQALNPQIRPEINAILEGLQGETAEPYLPNQSSSTQVEPMPENERNFRKVSTSEVAEKLLADNKPLTTAIDNFAMPEINTDAFAEPVAENMMAASPSILPNEKDREIAMRQQAGIAGLV